MKILIGALIVIAGGLLVSACTVLDSRGRKVVVIPPLPVVVIEKDDNGKHKGHHKNHRDDD